jgi:ribonuclease VapC
VILDTSALVAILRGEPDRAGYSEALARSPRGVRAISAANFLETAIVLDRDPDPVPGRALDRLLRDEDIDVVAVTPEHARIARAAYRDFGKGSGHAAALNYGDCFAYALATERSEPLLFKGDGFTHTDVRNALG